MTADDEGGTSALALGTMTGTRLRALLQAALESPIEEGVHVDAAASASRLLAAFGRRVCLPGVRAT